MARIRTIKPDFFRDEELQDLEAANPGCYTMLVYAGLWGHCDKNGTFEYRPRQLKLDILPFIPFNMDQALELLSGAGFICPFEVDGKKYAHIPEFTKHQRINGKEAQEEAKYPEYVPGKQRGSNGEAVEITGREGKGIKEGAFGSVIFTECLDYLTSCGQSEKQARAFLGMLLRDWDETVVAAAVRSSVGKADSLAYARKILSAQPKKPKAPEGSHAVLAKLREKYPNVRLASDGRAFFDPATQNRFSLTGERLASA